MADTKTKQEIQSIIFCSSLPLEEAEEMTSRILALLEPGWRDIEEYHKTALLSRPEFCAFFFEPVKSGRQVLPAMVSHEPVRGFREATKYFALPTPQPKSEGERDG